MGNLGSQNWVVDLDQLLASVPKELPFSRQRPELRYQLADDLVAVAGGEAGPEAAAVLEGGISVRPASTLGGETDEDAAIRPVYRRGPGGGVAVPTGLVLVRFAEGDPADGHRRDLAAAGYQIEQVLGYAPQAAWVRADSGGLPEALRHLDRLDAVPGIENVEVQMVSESSPRGPGP